MAKNSSNSGNRTVNGHFYARLSHADADTFSATAAKLASELDLSLPGFYYYCVTQHMDALAKGSTQDVGFWKALRADRKEKTQTAFLIDKLFELGSTDKFVKWCKKYKLTNYEEIINLAGSEYTLNSDNTSGLFSFGKDTNPFGETEQDAMLIWLTEALRNAPDNRMLTAEIKPLAFREIIATDSEWSKMRNVAYRNNLTSKEHYGVWKLPESVNRE
ncbi:MAG: hypothetical protein GY804_11440 [Alphaproteobacteria bacterium]|nr:hypothetical protein [Alphaproteobacteria bacterium]